VSDDLYLGNQPDVDVITEDGAAVIFQPGRQPGEKGTWWIAIRVWPDRAR
jgi:hypothetical protein